MPIPIDQECLLSQALVGVVADHVRVGMGARLLRPDHHFRGRGRNPSSVIWTRHDPHIASVNVESDGCQLGRSSLVRGQPRGDAPNTSLSLALMPISDSSEVDFED